MSTFKKAAVFTDLHLGAKGNSPIHNKDCMDFINWFIKIAKENNCETGIFMGDFHHNRNNLNITTLNYSVSILEKLSKSFEQFFFMVGNHDLYYKDKRDTHSVVFGKYMDNITVVDNIVENDDVAFVPWLVGEEWKTVQKIKSPIIFGHFELPNFYMNALIKMPDTGHLNAKHFANQEYVFSGHFHKRQHQGKIHYIGNAFPHNYADAWDDDRGMMIFDMEGNKPPQYVNWDNCPKYRTINLSTVLEDPSRYLKEKAFLSITIDVPISYEEAYYIRDLFMNEYKCREISLLHTVTNDEMESDLEISKFESVDQIVIEEILDINSDTFNQRVLLEIYENL